MKVCVRARVCARTPHGGPGNAPLSIYGVANVNSPSHVVESMQGQGALAH